MIWSTKHKRIIHKMRLKEVFCPYLMIVLGQGLLVMNRDKRITVKIASIRTFNTAKVFKMIKMSTVFPRIVSAETILF